MGNNSKVKVGLLGGGLNTYWGQFEGLLSRLQNLQNEIGKRLTGLRAEVIDVGLIDSPEKASSAFQKLQSGNVEIVFVSILTYALSSTVLPVVRDLKKRLYY